MPDEQERDKIQLKRLRNERTQLRRVFTALTNVIDKNASEGKLEEMPQNFAKLEDKATRLFKIDSQVSDLLFSCDEGEEEIAREYDSIEEYRDKYTTLLALKSQYDNVTTNRDLVDARSVSSDSRLNKTKDLRLPKLMPREFDGSLKEWIPFWAIFERIHLSEEYDDSTKFQYLLLYTKENSPARELVGSLPPLAENYSKAIEQLKSRFGREDLLIDLYVRELLKLVLIQARDEHNLTLRSLYDRLSTQLNALDTLGLTSDKFTYFLTPLVESALPDSVLKDWKKESKTVVGVHTHSNNDDTSGEVSHNKSLSKLKQLLDFLRREVEEEEGRKLARDTFSEQASHQSTSQRFSKQRDQKGDNKKETYSKKIPTAAGLVNNVQAPKSPLCIFCEKGHSSDNCFTVRDLSLQELNSLIQKKGACFCCLKRGHSSQRCRAFVRCILCSRRHYPLLCPSRKEKGATETGGTKSGDSSGSRNQGSSQEQNLLNSNCSQVLMQTLLVKVKGERGEIQARLLFDSGSQRSYITKRLAVQMNYVPTGEETLIHMLFGGSQERKPHSQYKVRVGSLHSDYTCNFDVLDTDTICCGIASVARGPWMSELKRKNIKIFDNQNEPVDILVGADIAGKLMTGHREVLNCGLIAFETLIGWTVMGRVRDATSNFMINIDMLNTSLSVTDLWKLDVIGIEDPAQVRSKAELALATQQHFDETVKIREDGRYEVRLPWQEGHAPLPTNFNIAKTRLDATMKKLKSAGTVASYQEVLMEWLNDGIIEEVHLDGKDRGHFLPHRPVYKQNSTTAIRPVFDASAQEKGQPSLNDCLAKGCNLIELIPSVLLRFRMGRLGVIADIRRAFLQIALTPTDRDFLKFLWYKDGELRVYRHCRVVFGVNSSPFLLGAVLDHLMKKTLENKGHTEQQFSEKIVKKLQKSWYVDNAIASVSSVGELEQFIQESTAILGIAQFELRGWEYSDVELNTSTDTAVLGIQWDRKLDCLKLHVPEFRLNDYSDKVTRRKILSAYQKIFDPIGMCAPTTLVPKMLIQKTWALGNGWDEEVDSGISQEFKCWVEEVRVLKEISISRYVDFEESQLSIHTFCDASQKAFAAVVYLRVESKNKVFIHLLAAKSRVSPVNKVTIPRLELLAAGIGARLASHVMVEFGSDIESWFWSDSTVVLAWINRDTTWGVFVKNRVDEIKALTDKHKWRHVPGPSNPADLLSRGCSPRQLMLSKWWEGPQWLKNPITEWPNFKYDEDEVEILKESRKTVVSAVNMSTENVYTKLINEISDFGKLIKIFGWIYHWKNKQRRPGILSCDEIDQGEKGLLKFVQSQSFQGPNDKSLRRLKPIYDSKGIMRIRTKIMNRKDDEFFKLPIALPSDHPVVRKLIDYVHRTNHHTSGQTLLSLLREKYWIIRSRKAVRQVVNKCVSCRRYEAKNLEVDVPALPEERVRDANIFEISGCDFAGPLYCHEGKVWIVIFTCAVYRAVHLDVVTSLSTDGFMMAFRRFVGRRGRPKVMFSDNGTNFRGMSNTLGTVDWSVISHKTSVEQIEWHFSPPSAPWWGGFWERMVGLLKNLLRKTLGNSILTCEELYTVLIDCEALINSRPITYYSEDPCDPLPISPRMFLQEIPSNEVPDCDEIESTNLEKRIRYRQRVRDDLKRRFRSEYLGQLVQIRERCKETRPPIEGEIVLIGSNEKRRMDWPLAIVERVVLGHDGKSRVVHLRTSEGSLCRPVKRVYPLEVFCTNREKDYFESSEVLRQSDESTAEVTTPIKADSEDIDIKTAMPQKILKRNCRTKCGRKVVIPIRYQ